MAAAGTDIGGALSAFCREFEATSLFCPRCRRATPVRSKLVLKSGNKYDYFFAELGTAVDVKTDNDTFEFYKEFASFDRRRNFSAKTHRKK